MQCAKAGRIHHGHHWMLLICTKAGAFLSRDVPLFWCHFSEWSANRTGATYTASNRKHSSFSMLQFIFWTFSKFANQAVQILDARQAPLLVSFRLLTIIPVAPWQLFCFNLILCFCPCFLWCHCFRLFSQQPSLLLLCLPLNELMTVWACKFATLLIYPRLNVRERAFTVGKLMWCTGPRPSQATSAW